MCRSGRCFRRPDDCHKRWEPSPAHGSSSSRRVTLLPVVNLLATVGSQQNMLQSHSAWKKSSGHCSSSSGAFASFASRRPNNDWNQPIACWRADGYERRTASDATSCSSAAVEFATVAVENWHQISHHFAQEEETVYLTCLL